MRTLAPALLALATWSCAVDQAKERVLYERELKLTGAAAAGAIGPAAGAPLTLRQAMLLANQHNERLAIEGENFVQAIIDKHRAVAAFLPTVDLLPLYEFFDNQGSGPSHQTTVGVSGTINLFNGFSDAAALRAAAATIEQRRALLREAQEQLLLEVAQVYYGVLQAQRAAQVLQNSLAVQEERIRDIRAKHEVGIARPLDVAQTEAQASTTRVALLDARNDVVNGRSVLEFITGAPVRDSELTDGFTPSPAEETPPAAAMLELALRQREDVRAAEAGTAAAREDVEVAFGQYYPSVSLDLAGFIERSPTAGPDWAGLVRANVPLFSAGLIRADVREAWSIFRQNALALAQLRRQVWQDVQVTEQDVATSRSRLAELQTQLAAGEQAFRQAEASYNVGLATNLERLTAQEQLLNAQLQLASEQYTQKLAYLNQLRAIGGLRVGDDLTPAISR